MTQVAVASSSRIAAAAGARIADEGGNAADAAIAAALVSITTEPAVCSPGSGGFVTVWPAAGDPVTIDGNVAMPGQGLRDDERGRGAREVYVEYGGGLRTLIGHGSVATPGAFAALGAASKRFGRLPWRRLAQPAIEWARRGFPLPTPSREYLAFAHEIVFGWDARSWSALHDEKGGLKDAGEPIFVADLADSLARIADHGVEDFYRGELAHLIADDSRANEGALTYQDLAGYEAVERVPLQVRLGEWRVATNPPPAVGGITLSAMLSLMHAQSFAGWTQAAAARLVRVQEMVLGYRRQRLDLSDDFDSDALDFLDRVRSGELARALGAPSTVHTSSVDDEGLACAITLSAGYGSGVMPPGTGMWMNNCLGEIELNRRGLTGSAPGTRLPSNMAPTVARRNDGSILAIGSPGADRITTALLCTLVGYMEMGMSLPDAVGHARAHLEFHPDGRRVAYEPGMPVEGIGIATRRFEDLSMYFGGVGAVLWSPRDGFVTAADPRRTGGEAMGGRR
jgi:gamma-glutamyltranspeptidase/glutathione hydrolase